MSTLKNGRSEKAPFTTIDLLAVITATPEEQAVLLAIQFLHWWLGPEEGKGLDLILAVLVDNDQPQRIPVANTKDTLGQITERQVKRALARLRARGWVTESKTFSGAKSYRLTVPALTWREAQGRVLGRLPDAIRARLAPKDAGLLGQPGLPLGPGSPPIQASLAPPNNKRLDLQPRKTPDPWQDIFSTAWCQKTGESYWPLEKTALDILASYRNGGVTEDQFKGKLTVYLQMDHDEFVVKNRFNLMTMVKWRWLQLKVEQPVQGRKKPEVAV